MAGHCLSLSESVILLSDYIPYIISQVSVEFIFENIFQTKLAHSLCRWNIWVYWHKYSLGTSSTMRAQIWQLSLSLSKKFSVEILHCNHFKFTACGARRKFICMALYSMDSLFTWGVFKMHQRNHTD